MTRCDHPGCVSHATNPYLVGLGGMTAFYCVDHAPFDKTVGGTTYEDGYVHHRISRELVEDAELVPVVTAQKRERVQAHGIAEDLLACGPDEAEWQWDDRILARAFQRECQVADRMQQLAIYWKEQSESRRIDLTDRRSRLRKAFDRLPWSIYQRLNRRWKRAAGV